MDFMFSGSRRELAELVQSIRGGSHCHGITEQIARLAAGRADLSAAVAGDDPGSTDTASMTTGDDSMDPMEALKAEVAADVSVMGSAAKLIRGFGQRLTDGIAAARAGDFTNLDQFRSDLNSAETDLAAAVAENTPADGGGTAGGVTAPGQSPKKHK